MQENTKQSSRKDIYPDVDVKSPVGNIQRNKKTKTDSKKEAIFNFRTASFSSTFFFIIR